MFIAIQRKYDDNYSGFETPRPIKLKLIHHSGRYFTRKSDLDDLPRFVTVVTSTEMFTKILIKYIQIDRLEQISPIMR